MCVCVCVLQSDKYRPKGIGVIQVFVCVSVCNCERVSESVYANGTLVGRCCVDLDSIVDRQDASKPYIRKNVLFTARGHFVCLIS